MANAARKTASRKTTDKADATAEEARVVSPDEAPAVAGVESPELNAGLSDDEVKERRRKAYSIGQTRLREQHKDVFQRLVKEAAAELGVSYEFQKTAAEKAAEQVRELLAAHPELREQLLVSDLPPAERPLSYTGDEPVADA